MRPGVRDTIVALSSATGSSGGASRDKSDVPRAIIRLSGSRACEIAGQVFETSTTSMGTFGKLPDAGKQRAGSHDLFEKVQGWRRISGEVRWRAQFLPAHAYVMRSPHSYTREDVVELHVPGLPWLISDLLDRLLHSGARLAQAGEFTRRALENGRISIDQAEAVGAIVLSRTADEARVHAARLKTALHSEHQKLRSEIEDLLSMVELGLDFSQEDVGVLSEMEILVRLKQLHARAQQISGGGESQSRAAEAALLSSGLPRVLLLGPTNAGKSSLFNRLLGRPAAIVSDSRHTTRDAIEAPLAIAGAPAAVLVDSAGFGHDLLTTRAPESLLLRQSAWNATLSAVRSADIILLAIDASEDESSRADLTMFSDALNQSKPAVVAIVWTKSDLSRSAAALAAVAGVLGPNLPQTQFETSAISGAGVNELREFLAAKIAEIGARPRDAYLAASTAAKAAARTAAEALARACSALEQKHGEDVVAVELREAIHAFWQSEGILIRHDAVTESTLDRIFSKFCIGK